MSWARATGVGAVATWALQFVVTHWPTPTAVSVARADDVRETWRAAARIGRAVGKGGHWPSALEWVPGDKLLHAALFFGVGGLAMACAILAGWKRGALAWLFGALLVLAAVDEWSQCLVGRDAELGDGLANGVGVALGVVLVWVMVGAWRGMGTHE